MADLETSNRRPLAVRRWTLFEKLAARIADAGATPNAISVSSMVFGCGAGACLALTSRTDAFSAGQRACWLAAAALVQLRLIANLLDGMVAIEGGKKSAVGELYNEVPDRVSDTAILVGAGYAVGASPWMGYLAAVVALFVAYVRAIGAGVGAGQVFVGPMAKQQRMAVVTLAAVLLGVLPAAWTPAHDGGHGVMALALLLIVVGGMVTAVRRLRRIASFMKQSEPS